MSKKQYKDIMYRVGQLLKQSN